MPDPCPCSDFSRTELFRRAAARAGSGLPAIEPGMPLPAGTGLSRRSLLLRTLGLTLAVYGGNRLSSSYLEDGIAQAATVSGPAEPVLVSVFLEGGADSLSILFPNGDPLYRTLRPTLALPATTGIPFPDDNRLLWHPATQGLATLHAEGKVSVLPAVGYDHPDKSHFTSRHYWEVGATDTSLLTGWLGRYLDLHGTLDNPLQGLSLDTQLQPALASSRMPVAALDSPDNYSFSRQGRRQTALPLEAQMLTLVSDLGAAHGKSIDPALQQAGQVASQVQRLRQQLRPLGADNGQAVFGTPVPYPQGSDPFPHRLAGLAAMLAIGLPVRCAALRAPGMYDTHSAQPDALSKGLKLTSDSLLAFQRDLQARGLADRVIVHVWSEFGRRAKQNASDGTDHGAAGTGFLIGTRVQGGLIGEFPGLSGGLDDQGNLKPTADFRGLYSALLEQWFGVDATAIIPTAANFPRPTLLK